MSELMFLMFVISAGVMIFSSIQAIMNANVKLSYVFFALTFLSISVCLFLLGKYFTSFSVLFFMLIIQYINKYLSKNDPKQKDSTDTENLITDEIVEQNQVLENNEINVASDKQALYLLLSIGIFLLLSGFALYLSISDIELSKNIDSLIAQNLNLLWFSVFAVILTLIYFVINLMANTKTYPDKN